jgi:hypothetical protein
MGVLVRQGEFRVVGGEGRIVALAALTWDDCRGEG